MTTCAIIGTMNTAPRPKTLTVAGNDVLKPQGAMGNTFGVPIETIEVVEAGVGNVSSMSFDIDDPNIVFVVNDGDEIRFYDFTNSTPIFTGWVQRWNYAPDFGRVGRVIHVEAVGIDVLLDWAVIASDMTFTGNPSSTDLLTAMLSLAGNTSGTPGLRALGDTANAGGQQATPTGPMFVGSTITTNTVTVTAGTTLREALRQVSTEATIFLASFGITPAVTVDMYGGLRTFMLNDLGRLPMDWGILTLVTTIGAIKMENLVYDVDAASLVRGVYVKGASGAASGLFMDGTGKAGDVATLQDSTITTAAQAQTAATAYLKQFQVGVRGSYELQDWTPTSYTAFHGGGLTKITDDTISSGGGGTQFTIGSIRKTFTATRENWTVAFGGQAPSAVRAIRRLTRGTLS